MLYQIHIETAPQTFFAEAEDFVSLGTDLAFLANSQNHAHQKVTITLVDPQSTVFNFSRIVDAVA